MLLLALALTAHAATWDESWARSNDLEAQGSYAEALAALAPLATDYPQDYRLLVRLGWLAFEAGDYATALRWYQAALDVSPDAYDARLGLAWTRLRLRGRRSRRPY